MKVTRRSTLTGKENTRDIPLTQEEFTKVENRHEPIQNIVPHLSADDREFLISGCTPEEWKSMLGDVSEDVFDNSPHKIHPFGKDDDFDV